MWGGREWGCSWNKVDHELLSAEVLYLGVIVELLCLILFV